ncbi:MAG: FHA domain-containing protein [Armatimonadetes bacterium]|nr:FHA domain-containing protein [Armatimonadota bacterium]
MGRVFFRALVCTLFAFCAWLITEPFLPDNIHSTNWAAAEQRMVLLIVSAIGLGAGLLQGYNKGGIRNIALSGLLGAVLGAVGGLFGYSLGGGISEAMFPGWATQPGFHMIPRTIAFAPLGLFLGAAIGSTQFSLRSIISGAVGGLIGGFAGGLAFDPIGAVLGPLMSGVGGAEEIGGPARALLACLLGLTIGLFTALIENATRQAWIRLVLGRNEGKEWPVDATRTNIGRDERAHVPLFGDTNVAPLHAVIVKQGAAYFLEDAGSPMGVGINGQKVGQVTPLNPGDTINIAGFQLQFLMKQGAAQRAHEARAKGVMVGGSGMGQPINPVQQGAMHQQPAQPMQQPMQPQQPVTSSNPTMAVSPQPQAQPAGRTLVCVSGPLTGQRFPVSGALEIGRELPTIPVAFDSQVSRRHARISQTPTGVQVDDLGSTNGTFVNGQRITNAAANPGDTVQIGTSTFQVE